MIIADFWCTLQRYVRNFRQWTSITADAVLSDTKRAQSELFSRSRGIVPRFRLASRSSSRCMPELEWLTIHVISNIDALQLWVVILQNIFKAIETFPVWYSSVTAVWSGDRLTIGPCCYNYSIGSNSLRKLAPSHIWSITKWKRCVEDKIWCKSV